MQSQTQSNATEPPSQPPGTSSGKSLVLPIVSLVAVFALIAWFVRHHDTQQAQPPTPPTAQTPTGSATPNTAVVIDLGRIVAARISQMLKSTASSPTQISAANEEFAQRLHAKLSELTGQGLIVVDAQHTLGYPRTADRTDWLANALGIDLSAVPASLIATPMASSIEPAEKSAATGGLAPSPKTLPAPTALPAPAGSAKERTDLD